MNENKKGLTVFSLTMMTLGTVIGGSFFLGSAFPVKTSGPSVIIAFLFCGLLVYFILFALSELTVHHPTVGSFRIYAQNAFGNGAGFTVGWLYWTGLIIGMSSEAVAVSLLFQTFIPEASISLIGSLVIAGVIAVNLLGTEKLSYLESTLAGIKLLAILSFIVLGILLLTGVLKSEASPTDVIRNEPFFNGGLKGLLGSNLLVMFAYAGFEIVGLAATETSDPERMIPKSILYTVICLLFLYIVSTIILLLLIPVSELNGNSSPFVAALLYHHIESGAKIINAVLIVAILSTMLASIFGLARTLHSLAKDGFAPKFIMNRGNIPYKGILVSGLMIYIFFSLSFFLPKTVYLFLVSSSGFALLFTYLMIVLSHYKYRKNTGCPYQHCQLPVFPFSSWFTAISLIVIILSMPFVKGQGMGLIAGGFIALLYFLFYLLFLKKRKAAGITNHFEK